MKKNSQKKGARQHDESYPLRICPAERRQKAVMDIDNLVRIGVHKDRLEYLHIAGEHEEIYFIRNEGFLAHFL